MTELKCGDCAYCKDNRLHNRYKTDEDTRLKIKEVEECRVCVASLIGS